MKALLGIRASLPWFLLISAACTSSDLGKAALSLELGDYTMAIRFYSRVLERNPGHFAARLGMGKAHLQKAVDDIGDTSSWREAIMHLEAARTIRGGKGIDNLLSQVWSERASGTLLRGDTLASLELLTRAIACDPLNPEPLNLAGIIYFRTGKAHKARLLFERASAADTANSSFLFNLGMVHWEEKRVKDAHDLWLRALKFSPGDEEFLYWFAAAEKAVRDKTPDTAGTGEEVQ